MSPQSAHNPIELDNIRHLLEQSEKPLTATELGKLLKQKSGKAIKPVLDAEVRAGRIYAWGASVYWGRNPRDMARERLLKLTTSEILTKGSLDKRAASEAAKISPRVVREVRVELAKEGLLRDLAPPPGSKSKAKVIVNARNPVAYLEQVIVRLEAVIVRLLANFGIERSKEQVRALLVEPDVREVAEKIFAAMNRIAFAPGTTVTFYRLHQQPELAHIPKPVFDRAALLLQQERRALLAEHGHAPRLPKVEQDELVTDGLGTYYVSIYAL